MDKNTAQMELMVLQTKTKDVAWLDAVTIFTNQGIPQEIVFRLQELWEKTKVIAGQVYEVGKIIVLKIIEFIKANPHTTGGIAIGATIGALVNLIPFIGSMLAPLAMAVSGFLGGVAGAKLDRIARGEISTSDETSNFENIVVMAKEFFKLFSEIFKALKEYFVETV